MRIERFIARRYLKSLRHAFTLRLLRGIGITGIAVGIFALIVVLSVMKGFEKDFRDKVMGFSAHVSIDLDQVDEAADLAQTLKQRYPAIAHLDHRIEGELVIETSFNKTAGARIRGIINPQDALKKMDGLYLPHDRGSDLREHKDRLPGIILGRELAAALQVFPDFADEVRLVFPFGDITPTGDFRPRVRRFDVIGTFDTGFYEYDYKFAFIDQTIARRLFGEFARESLAIYLHDPAASKTFKKTFLEDFPEKTWSVHTWGERNKRLFEALTFERFGMFCLLGMIVLIASLSIFALVSVIVLEKTKDMAVLQSFGLQKKQVRRIFVTQAMLIGLKGTVIGAALASLLCLWFSWFPIRLPPSYYVEFLPVSLDWKGILLFLLLGPLMSLLAGLWPATQASKGSVADILRYE